MSELPLEISPLVAGLKQAAGAPLTLIDVREPDEYLVARLEDSQLFPMSSLSSTFDGLQALAKEGPLIVYCHHGIRSLRVVEWLRSKGIENCQSLEGGIDRWSLQIDSTIPRY